jgi:hypothetical protein
MYERSTFIVLRVVFHRVSADLYVNTELGIEVHGNYSRGLFYVCRVVDGRREWITRRCAPHGALTRTAYKTRTIAAKKAMKVWNVGRSIPQKKSKGAADIGRSPQENCGVDQQFDRRDGGGGDLSLPG